ncbi:hypothetical protein KUTeg_020039 [Tegillarca granosa]|uniref:Uncharacterized protein n=1 Tax=Tegillarca granosa TaxID=220873 RepID=A0ABQ9EK77_TEGGR|nr:hypothetical protein KUTeg_020039 [Tegillarca granosa]
MTDFPACLSSIISSRLVAKLEAIQTVLNSHATKFKEVFHTSWLSFEGSVHAIVVNYPALLSVFMEEKSGRALSLHKPVSTYKFLYCANFFRMC